MPKGHSLASQWLDLGGLIEGLKQNASPADFERQRRKLLAVYRALARRYRVEKPKPGQIVLRGRVSVMRRASKKRALAWAIAQQVKLARSRKGWRQEDLSRSTGIARPNIARLEAGRQVPKLPTLSVVADALGLDVKALVSMPRPIYGGPDARLGEQGVADWVRQLNDLERKR